MNLEEERKGLVKFAESFMHPGPHPRVDTDLRCKGTHTRGHLSGKPCRKLIVGSFTRPWSIKCPRCGYLNQSG